MKGIILRFFLTGSFLAMLFSEAFAVQAIYGFKQAASFHASNPGPFYIQVGAFRHAELAQQLKHALEESYHNKVEVLSKADLNIVRIGPLASAEDVRAVGHKNDSQREVSQSKPMPVRINKHNSQKMPAREWFLGADLDFLFPHLNKTITVNNGSNYPPPENLDRFSSDKRSHGAFGFQVGRRWARNPSKWIPFFSLGLNYQHLLRRDIDGSITQYSSPEFKNYNYRWATSANVVGLAAKANITQWRSLMPYVNVGIGASINHTGRYLETAFTGVTPRISPDFRTRDKAELYYDVGAGLDFSICPKLLVSLGYDFQSYGPNVSGYGLTSWSAEKLRVGRFGNSSVRLGLTYLLEQG